MFSINRSFRGLGRGDDVLPGWSSGLSKGQVGLLITNAEDLSWIEPIKDYVIVYAGKDMGGHPYEEEHRQITEGANELLRKGCTFILKLSQNLKVTRMIGIKELIEMLDTNDWIGTNGQPNPRVYTGTFLARADKLVEMTKYVNHFVPDEAYGNIIKERGYKWVHITGERYATILGL